MGKNLFLFMLGGLTVLAGKRYSRPLGRAVVRNAVQVNRTVRKLAAEAIRESDEIAGAEGAAVRRIAAVPARRERRATLPEPS